MKVERREIKRKREWKYKRGKGRTEEVEVERKREIERMEVGNMDTGWHLTLKSCLEVLF